MLPKGTPQPQLAISTAGFMPWTAVPAGIGLHSVGPIHSILPYSYKWCCSTRGAVWQIYKPTLNVLEQLLVLKGRGEGVP